MMNKVISAVIGLMILSTVMYIGPYVYESIAGPTMDTERIQTVNVFFNDEGTDATEFTVGLYDSNGRLRGTTYPGEVLGDSWCSATFPNPIMLSDNSEYALVVSTDGDFSIPGDESTGYIYENVSAYQDFPGTVDMTDTASLSIYAEFI